MGDDIVNELRGIVGTQRAMAVCRDAADEIERLRAEVARLGAFLHPIAEKARRG